jgi:FAD/FMN-containing dehydrogenase
MTHDLGPVSLRTGDEGYDAAATVYMRTGTPGLVVRARQPEDIAAAVRHAVEGDLPLSVRSGGHSAQAWGTNDGGVVIDVGGFDSIELLHEETGRVRIGTGAVWGDVAAQLGEWGLSLTSGDTKSVGVGGLTTGGGIGWMVRNHGLTIDSVVAADVVTADGRVLHTSESEHPDLFWGVRGGGGNFGVVTHFEYLAQRVTTVHAGLIMYTVDDVPGLLGAWMDVHRKAPEELNSTLVLMPGLGEPMPPAGAMGLVCFAGADKDAADAAFEPLLSLGTVVMHDIAQKAYADVLEEAHPPPGFRNLASNTLVESVDVEVIDAISRFYDAGTASRIAFVRALGGAVNRVAGEATAFPHRNVEALVVGAVFAEPDATDEELAERLRPFDELHALGVGSYAGFLGTDTPEDVRRLYPPDTLKRLQEVKRAYDPDNVFCNNFNIRP